ncbi:MAG: PhoH family protein [Elusimicrobiota bacterium]|jgi:phosphate starvation-inducible PhoH-like protein
MTTRKINLRDTEEAMRILGEQDAALRRMEEDYGVELCLSQDPAASALNLLVRGQPSRVAKAARFIRSQLDRVRRTSPERGRNASAPAPEALDPDCILRGHNGRMIAPRTPSQRDYINAIQKHELAFGIGPAGTGKTFLAVACALRALETRQVQRIILSRPVVEAGERLGFLPGDFLEKVNPYLRPIYDAFYSMIGAERFRLWRDSDVIEIVPLAYMRGRTFNDAFIILDEAQNTTLGQIKLALTRLGEGSRMVITGDITQSDLGEGTPSGLVRCLDILKGVEGVAFHHLSDADVVRHPLVRKVIKAFGKWEKTAK